MGTGIQEFLWQRRRSCHVSQPRRTDFWKNGYLVVFETNCLVGHRGNTGARLRSLIMMLEDFKWRTLKYCTCFESTDVRPVRAHWHCDTGNRPLTVHRCGDLNVFYSLLCSSSGYVLMNSASLQFGDDVTITVHHLKKKKRKRPSRINFLHPSCVLAVLLSTGSVFQKSVCSSAASCITSCGFYKHKYFFCSLF